MDRLMRTLGRMDSTFAITSFTRICRGGKEIFDITQQCANRNRRNYKRQVTVALATSKTILLHVGDKLQPKTIAYMFAASQRPSSNSSNTYRISLYIPDSARARWLPALQERGCRTSRRRLARCNLQPESNSHNRIKLWRPCEKPPRNDSQSEAMQMARLTHCDLSGFSPLHPANFPYL
jgi:hypothetical protein